MILRRGQIATTMTWAAALVVVLILMVVFFAMTAVLSGTAFFNKNQINFQEAGGLDFQRELIKILNSRVEVEGKEQSVKEVIVLWYGDREKYEDVLKNEIGKVLNEVRYEFVDSQRGLMEVAFGIVIYSFEKDEGVVEIDVASDRFYDNACFGTPNCESFAVYVPVNDLEFVYVTIQGSQGVKEVKNEE